LRVDTMKRGSRRFIIGVGAAAAVAATVPAAAQSRGTGGASAGQPFTVADALSVPFVSGLVAGPKSDVVAWVADSAGVRNIYVAAPSLRAPHRVTAYTQDDGQEITDLRWLPNLRGIVYVRGDGPNTQGEIPNPLLLPGGTDQSVWLVSLGPDLDATATPRRLGEGHAPAVAPNGSRVVFIDKDQVWAVSPDAGATAATQLLHTRGKASALRWSPDASHLAFVSDRATHAFVGVYDVAARTLTYLSPSTDRDEYPSWSPDGHRLAFVREPARTRAPVFGARRTGQPWSIWVAEPATGEGHEVWQAANGTGSVFHDLADDLSGVGGDDPADQIFWVAGDGLVFPWERDGWLHLYRVAASGGDATLLTPGAFEVEQAVAMPDRRSVVATTNQGDLERRRLWHVPLDGTAPTPLAPSAGSDLDADGIQWSPNPLSDGTSIVAMHAGARVPARPAIIRDGSPPRDIAPDMVPARFPKAALIEPQLVSFPAADGLTLHGEVFLPPGEAGAPRSGRHPAVVFYHGGSRRQMLLGWHYMQYYANAYALNQYLASRGYVVLSVNYRSGVGYGMEFREALDYGASGGSEYNDVQGAGLYLRSRPDVDPDRIGVWGGSYGGYLTALALARSSDLYAAGVDFHGVHDWNLEFDTFVPGWDTELDHQARKLAYQSSPMSSLNTWKSPVLLIQGDDDRSVLFTQTVELAEDLRVRGVHVEQLIFPDEGHDFLRHATWLAGYRATSEFLDRVLRDKAPTPH
jgi:dipeptidyl aminopeptidase/acylaminoacyl peptidase